MKKLLIFAIFLVWIDYSSTAVVVQKNNGTVRLTETEIRALLDDYNTAALKLCNKNGLASWEVQTNIGDTEKQQDYAKISAEYAEFRKKHWSDSWNKIPVEPTWTLTTRREFEALQELGSAALVDTDYKELLDLQTNMSAIYNSAKICPYRKQNCTDDERLTLDPEIEEVIAKSEDFDELAYTWKGWRDHTGKLMRKDYKKYVDLTNKAAVLNNYADASQWWIARYEDDKFVEKIDALWLQIEPLYNELHKYVKYHLFGIYGKKMDYNREEIPAHLLGNMWAQSWEYLYDKTKPFKKGSLIDVTDKMQELGYDAHKMFELSNEFYLSMGLEDNVMSYNPPSIIEKPTNRTINCHASAWDLCDGKDFRVKMCTNINMKDFITIHHEMGHIQYYLQYKGLPLALRGGANPGFHEAVGDTIALSVATPQHLEKVGLLENYGDTEDDNINALYKMALERVAFLPFGLLIDKWRWDVFSGATSEENWNKHWWDLRKKYQKVSPPFDRDENDFDPGAKYHVPANSQYIAYFVAHILEFQMYKSLCEEAKEFPAKDLHKCDFFHSKEAGKKLSDGLKMGTSQHWADTLEAITGTKELDAGALLEYFNPLYLYLKKKNVELQEEHKIRLTLETYDTDASKECNEFVTAEWNSVTDLDNEQKQEDYLKAVEKLAAFKKEKYETLFKDLTGKEFADEKIQRQIKFLTQLDTDILKPEELNELTNTTVKMVAVYNKAKVCPYNETDCDLNEQNVGWTLDPEIDRRMAESTDYDELEYIWQNWHDNSGRLMREDYKTYVKLMNKAAESNGFKDAGEMWKEDYEDPNLAENMNKLWDQIEPLYNELHKYVVRKLSKMYPNKIKENDEYLPANVLGNMWAQSWVNLYERIKPFDASDLDVTSSMNKLNFTAKKMMEVSDEFYGSLGLESNEMSYTGESIIEKPEQLIVCHASAWDFCNGADYRIKMCTKITQEDFITVHHEMGHIQYFILYKNQPIPFRNGANPGFHEAVGDTIALSVGTPTHLEKIGLLEDYDDSEEDNINALFKIALERIAFIPFGLLVDTYRWDIFSGKVKESDWNQHWEDLRKKYQKVVSPVARNESHFDAGAKYHVAANSQYMNYFFAHILEFQLYKAMCIAAGQYQPGNATSQPLHKCDFYQSQKAGDQLRAGLNLGQSKPWPEILKVMTGDKDLKADAILEYFDPLMKYLEKVNKEEPANDQLVPIIVGSVLGGLLLLSLIGYCIYHFRKRRMRTV